MRHNYMYHSTLTTYSSKYMLTGTFTILRILNEVCQKRKIDTQKQKFLGFKPMSLISENNISYLRFIGLFLYWGGRGQNITLPQ